MNKQISEEIVRAIDVAQAYRDLGVSSIAPESNGRHECTALWRDDHKMSAVIFTDAGQTYGSYRDSVVGGKPMSLFDVAVKCGRFNDWMEARDHYAKLGGTEHLLKNANGKNGSGNQGNQKNGSSGKSKGLRKGRKLSDRIALSPWSASDSLKCKPLMESVGASEYAFSACDCYVGLYPKTSANPQYVVAMPGKNLVTGNIDCYVLARADGELIQTKNGEEKRIAPGESAIIGETWLLNNLSTVMMVEGYSDLLCAIDERGGGRLLPVISTACGANEHASVERSATALTGKTIIMVHDCDIPGRDGALNKAEILRKNGCYVKFVKLPYEIQEKHGRDLRDYFNDGGSFDSLLALASDAELLPPIENVAVQKAQVHNSAEPGAGGVGGGGESVPESGEGSSISARCLSRFGCTVIGEDPDTLEVVCYSHFHRKQVRIKRLNYLQFCDLLQGFGPDVSKHVTQSNDSESGDKMKVSDVRNHLALEAGGKQVTDSSSMGPGVWAFEDCVALAGKGEIVEWGEEFTRYENLVYRDRFLDQSVARGWCDFSELQKYFEQSKDINWCRDVVKEMVDIFSRWDNLSCKGDPEMIAALVLSTWVQTGLPWRPIILVTGPKDSGKTTLMSDVLKPIFGHREGEHRLVYSANTSAAGMFQTIRTGSDAIILDEFEKSKFRHEVLDAFRTASRGEGQIIRGTSHQKARKYTIRHMPWLASIEADMDNAANSSRYIIIDLNTIPAGKGGGIKLPTKRELQTLGLKTLAVACSQFHKSVELYNEISHHAVPGLSTRIVESHSLPVAFLANIYGLDVEQSKEYLERFVGQYDFTEQQETDEEKLLADIMGAKIRIKADEYSVSELLFREGVELGRGTAEDSLTRNGIRTVEFDSKEWVFFAARMVRASLFDRTDRRDQNIGQILSRVECARKKREKMSGSFNRGVAIPVSILQKLGYGVDAPDTTIF